MAIFSDLRHRPYTRLEQIPLTLFTTKSDLVIVGKNLLQALLRADPTLLEGIKPYYYFGGPPPYRDTEYRYLLNLFYHMYYWERLDHHHYLPCELLDNQSSSCRGIYRKVVRSPVTFERVTPMNSSHTHGKNRPRGYYLRPSIKLFMDSIYDRIVNPEVVDLWASRIDFYNITPYKIPPEPQQIIEWIQPYLREINIACQSAEFTFTRWESLAESNQYIVNCVQRLTGVSLPASLITSVGVNLSELQGINNVRSPLWGI